LRVSYRLAGAYNFPVSIPVRVLKLVVRESKSNIKLFLTHIIPSSWEECKRGVAFWCWNSAGIGELIGVSSCITWSWGGHCLCWSSSPVCRILLNMYQPLTLLLLNKHESTRDLTFCRACCHDMGVGRIQAAFKIYYNLISMSKWFQKLPIKT
jgi:hypothetical protein